MKKPRLLCESDISRLIEVALAPGEVGQELPGIAARNALLVSLLYHHAMRLQSVLALRWGDINPGLTLPMQTSALPPVWPVGLYRHEQPLFWWWRQYVKGVKRSPAPKPLAFPMHRRRVQQVLAEIGARAGLGQVTASDLRYSRARHLADAGASVDTLKRALGLRTDKAIRLYLSTNPKEIIP